MDKTKATPLVGKQLRDHVVTTFDGEPPTFRPCAYFDEPLDCVRVISRDCSVTEERISPLFTVLEDTYASPSAGREQYVGFVIKGAKHYCQQHGIDLRVPGQLTALLDQILAESSEFAVRVAVQLIAKPMVEDKQIREVAYAEAA